MSSPCVGEREAEVQCFKSLEKKTWSRTDLPAGKRPGQSLVPLISGLCGFVCCLWRQTPFARAVCVVCPSPGQVGVVTLPCQSPSPDLELAGPSEAFSSTLSCGSSSGQGLSPRRAVEEGFPFLLSPWKRIGSGDVFIPVTICTFLPGEVARVITQEVKQEKRKKPNRNGGCGCTCVGCVSLFVFQGLEQTQRHTSSASLSSLIPNLALGRL